MQLQHGLVQGLPGGRAPAPAAHLPRGSVIRCPVREGASFESPSKGAAAPSRLCGFGRGMFGRGAFGVFARGVFGLLGAVDRATLY